MRVEDAMHERHEAEVRMNFPQDGKASTFPRVRLVGSGLWSTTSGISAF
jgi:hypothetical protein